MTATKAKPVERDPHARSATIAGIYDLYGWSRTYVYERLAAGDLESYMIGRRRFITIESADRLMAKLLKATA